ncbi:MAG: ISNCY family transposase [Nitrospirota bacterium]
MKENQRLKILQEVMAKERTVEKAALLLGVSERHAYRLLVSVRNEGAMGVIHGNRGRAPWNKLNTDIAAKIVHLRNKAYVGFNDRHFADELRDEEKISVGREKVRQLLRAAGIVSVKKVKKRIHRQRRKPMERFGEMLQGDGSEHDWLEGRGPRLTLIHFVDDATGYQWADFFPSETTEAYFKVIQRIIRKHGLPRSLYVDQHSAFRVNREDTVEEQISGRRPLTQFGRAMEELAISIIYASSAPAKGRVERRGGLDQDRLVSELRKANVSTLQEARVVLRRYLPKNNRRFARKPAKLESAFMPLPENCDLKQILCWKEERTVANDNTVSYHGETFQIPRSPMRQSFAKAKVAIHLCLDRSIHVFHKQQRIAYFKNSGIDPDILPVVPINSAALAAHSPTLTFSLGR